jgi:single-strand DNA-binding protein
VPDNISLTGVVATTPRHITTNEGLDITSFRLASSQRRYDKAHNSWVDVGTNWYTVTAFRQLAANMANSLSKGDRVVASGRLRIREWVNGEKHGMNIEVEAEAVGHDLSWGSSSFTKSLAQSTGGTGGSAAPTAADDDRWRMSPASGGGGSAADWGAGAFGTMPGADGFVPEETAASADGGEEPADSGDSELFSHSPHLDSLPVAGGVGS